MTRPSAKPHGSNWIYLTLCAAVLALAGCGGSDPGGAEKVSESTVASDSSDVVLADDESEFFEKELIVPNEDDIPEVAEDDFMGAVAKASSTGGTIKSQAMDHKAAVRLADQASFGATDKMLASMKSKGAALWISKQMKLPVSTYTRGGSSAIHTHTSKSSGFCDKRGSNCWRDYYSTTPLVWDFYRNATTKTDQLRQRVAFALQQIVVVSGVEISGTYGMRAYNNMLMANAFGNYRDILKKVTLSPVMGDYLDHVNNDKEAPNENFARELLQLFAIGTCELNLDGTLSGGTCTPTYNNDKVRDYAFALTGWTYPKGGKSPWGCWPRGTNCQYYKGYMAPVAALHNTSARTLLSGVALPEGNTAAQALEAVLNSLMNHPNTAPFVSKQLIQHLVTSNPSPAYVQRVATAFNTGRFQGFGKGLPGDLKAVVAAILLDEEARSATPPSTAGKLREPAHFFVSVIRSMKGKSDGDALGWWWGEEFRQHVFRSPSVFNFYPPDYPLAGTSLVGPEFGIHNASAALQRMNFLNYLVFWGGSKKEKSVPKAVGTYVSLSSFAKEAKDPAILVDRLSSLALGEPLPSQSRDAVINAVAAITPERHGTKDYLNHRVSQAAYLVFASPQFQLIR